MLKLLLAGSDALSIASEPRLGMLLPSARQFSGPPRDSAGKPCADATGMAATVSTTAEASVAEHQHDMQTLDLLQTANQRLHEVVAHWRRKYAALEARQQEACARLQPEAERAAAEQETQLFRTRALERLRRENSELRSENSALRQRSDDLLQECTQMYRRHKELRQQLSTEACMALLMQPVSAISSSAEPTLKFDLHDGHLELGPVKEVPIPPTSIPSATPTADLHPAEPCEILADGCINELGRTLRKDALDKHNQLLSILADRMSVPR